MPRVSSILTTMFLLAFAGSCWGQDSTPPKRLTDLPLVFQENFEKDAANWEVTDKGSWKHEKRDDGNHVFGITRRQSDYKPKVRSPRHIALIKGIEVADFELTFRVRGPNDTGAHRDCCAFFNYQDPTHFYYVHLGAKPDPASGQIMIVNDKPRTPITKNERKTPWTEQWHWVKVVRDTKRGTIEVYFDDMSKPHMSAKDKTFGRGRVGIGSFDDINQFDNVTLHGK